MKNNEDKILKRDGRLLRNEKSWRRARIGAIFFVIASTLILLSISGDDFMPKEEKETRLFAIGWMFFWWLIVDWLTLRIRHIDSINLYRKMNQSA